MAAVIVHGGAGLWKPDKHERAVAGLEEAVRVARDALTGGEDAVGAAIAACIILEDHPLYNAGTGSALNIDGEVELDACIMVGNDLTAGAVAGLRRVRNPILVADAVRRQTDHVMLAGDGANRFARALGFPDYDPITDDRRQAWRAMRERLFRDGDDWLPRMRDLTERYPDLTHGTIGVTVADDSGLTCACTSTGGVVLKLVGRVGDSPLPGAGNYANGSAAASATGRGELCMRTLATRELCDRVSAGATADEAARDTVEFISRTIGDGVGLIAVDRFGNVGAAHSTDAMPHGYWTSRTGEIVTRLRAEDPALS